MIHPSGFFDLLNRVEDLNAAGNPLEALERVVNWERFRPLLQEVREKELKNNSGRRPFEVVLMVNILILQSPYTLSDERTEFQIRDRISFMQFLGLRLSPVTRTAPHNSKPSTESPSPQYPIFKSAPQFIDKVRLYPALPGRAIVLCVDEKSQCQALTGRNRYYQ